MTVLDTHNIYTLGTILLYYVKYLLSREIELATNTIIINLLVYFKTYSNLISELK